MIPPIEPPTTAPLVSIITPSFNQADFLAHTLASVAEQSYPRIEHIVRDGGSTDGSVEILQAAERDQPPDRFKWLSEADDGQAAAINKAVREASGEIICWLNSDDTLTAEAAARAVAYFQENPTHVMVHGRARWMDAAGRLLDWYPTIADGGLEDFSDGCFICQPTVFLRREAFIALNGLDDQLYAAHDLEFWIRLFKAAPDRVGFLDADQARSRVHEATKTRAEWDRAAIEAMRVVHRHFGAAPTHWVYSMLDECLSRLPSPDGPDQHLPRARQWSRTREISRLLDPVGRGDVMRRLRADARLAVANSEVVVEVWPDGWASGDTKARVVARGYRWLTLRGRQAHPDAARQELTARIGDRVLARRVLLGNLRFTWSIPLPDLSDNLEIVTVSVMTPDTFVPPESGGDRVMAASDDPRDGGGDEGNRRSLSVLIDGVELA